MKTRQKNTEKYTHTNTQTFWSKCSNGLQLIETECGTRGI